MADNSLIEWTDATWNPITGCSVISPGCANCYAMKLAGGRLRHHPSREGLTEPSKAGPVWNGQVRLNEDWLAEPLRWKRPRKIFVCAHGDLFHDQVPDAWLDLVFAHMAASYRHTYQVLTKRPGRMRAYLSNPLTPARIWSLVEDGGHSALINQVGAMYRGRDWPLPHVWLGVSAEDQPRADERIPELLATPAAVRFLSAEPLIARTHIAWALRRNRIEIAGGFLSRGHFSPGLETLRPLDLVIVGGESGPDARPMHPDWVRLIRDDCALNGVPFFFKQWGSWAPVCEIADMDQYYEPAPARDPEAIRRCKVADLVLHADGSQHRGYGPETYAAGTGAMMCMHIGKRAAGRVLDGRTWSELPEPHRHG